MSGKNGKTANIDFYGSDEFRVKFAALAKALELKRPEDEEILMEGLIALMLLTCGDVPMVSATFCMAIDVLEEMPLEAWVYRRA